MKKRLAWFTPLPPIRSGISQYSIELIPTLLQNYEIDIFVNSQEDLLFSKSALNILDAHDFIHKHAQDPYASIIYQMGNAPCHAYMWPYLVQYPGLVVLHDANLHHSRARTLLQEGRPDDYRTEFSYNHPSAPCGVAELGLNGLLGSLYYLWPMRQIILDASRTILVHNSWLANIIKQEQPTLPVEVVEMGVPPPESTQNANNRLREIHHIDKDAILFTAFGKITPEKRISQILRSLASLNVHKHPWHLLLCGESVEHYRVEQEASNLGIGNQVSVTGYVSDDQMSDHLTASDIGLCLRWPSARETSASWLRFLAAGKPTIITDLSHLSEIPSLDPRNWQLTSGPTNSGRTIEPICISIDIVDEEHSLSLALSRLCIDTTLRNTLGQAAHNYWKNHFNLEKMRSGYIQAIEKTCAFDNKSETTKNLPKHLFQDGTEHLRSLLRDIGVTNELDM